MDLSPLLHFLSVSGTVWQPCLYYPGFLPYPFQGRLVKPNSKAVLRDMQHVITTRNSRPPKNHKVVMCYFIIRGLVVFLVGRQSNNTRILRAWKPGYCINIRIHQNLLVGKYFDLGSIPFHVIFSLQCVHEATQLVMGKGAIILILVFHLILHGYMDTILSCDTDFLLRKLMVAEWPICLIKHVSLLRSWRQVLG